MLQHFDPEAEQVNAYALLTALVVPRPIAWISTVSADGVGNLAPHSFFTVACAEPPILAFASIGRKDTLRNVLATEELTVSVASEPLLHQVNATSARFPADRDEAGELGIAMAASTVVAPPRVAASPASLECRLHSTVDLGSSVLVLARVVWISVDDSALRDGRPAYDLLAPLARLGGSQWGIPGEVRDVVRPGRPEDVGR